MIDVIGKELNLAVEIFNKQGYEVIIKEYKTDKQKNFDFDIVIRQKLIDGKVELVVSNFLLYI